MAENGTGPIRPSLAGQRGAGLTAHLPMVRMPVLSNGRRSD
ncbi:hypothetical protein [Allosphingosinicella flava]|nr:hypothetical protein [Sphingosinicella flava]